MHSTVVAKMWVQKAHFDFNCLLWFSAGVTEQGSTVQFLKLWCRLGTAGKFSGNLQNARETGQRGVPDIFQMTLHRTLLLTAFERRFQWLQTKIQRRGRYYEHGRETHLVGGVGNEVKGKEKCGRIKKKWQMAILSSAGLTWELTQKIQNTTLIWWVF